MPGTASATPTELDAFVRMQEAYAAAVDEKGQPMGQLLSEELPPGKCMSNTKCSPKFCAVLAVLDPKTQTPSLHQLHDTNREKARKDFGGRSQHEFVMTKGIKELCDRVKLQDKFNEAHKKKCDKCEKDLTELREKCARDRKKIVELRERSTVIHQRMVQVLGNCSKWHKLTHPLSAEERKLGEGLQRLGEKMAGPQEKLESIKINHVERNSVTEKLDGAALQSEEDVAVLQRVIAEQSRGLEALLDILQKDSRDISFMARHPAMQGTIY